MRLYVHCMYVCMYVCIYVRAYICTLRNLSLHFVPPKFFAMYVDKGLHFLSSVSQIVHTTVQLL